MKQVIYTGIINDSDTDRCEVFTSENKERVLQWLWKKYRQAVEDYKLEEDSNVYEAVDGFEYYATSFCGSAYIQLSSSHINYELHETELQ